MSGNALKDLNNAALLVADGKCDSSNGGLAKHCSGYANKNLKNGTTEVATTPILKSDGQNEIDSIYNNTEVANLEIEYIESENLTDLVSLEAALNTLLERLNSKDWVLVCEALNNVRQISVFHKEKLLENLNSILSLIVKSLKNPRSAVCKTAIMTSADLFKAYGDCMIDSVDPLLVQLLLKSSQDKRFVCEAAERALISMTTWVSPTLLLSKLQPYLKHKSPRVRAKASMCFSRSVTQMGMDGIKSYGVDKLIQIAASQLSDQLPESREAARVLALQLQAAYEKSNALLIEDSEPSKDRGGSWKDFCQSKLSPLIAQAVLRVTSTTNENLVMGS